MDKDREIVCSRVFDAPRERVFEAVTDPRQVVKWWGPKGFTSTVQQMELWPGGIWKIVMHGPDGTDYANKSVFVEVAKPERLVFQHLEPVHKFRMTMTFAEVSGKTRLTWEMLFDSAAECERVKPIVPDANEQNFDRLASHLKANK